MSDRMGETGMRLPEPRGRLTELLFERLTDPEAEIEPPSLAITADPLDDHDLQLALFCCHELHYGGIEGVSESWEWRPSLIAFTAELEQAMFEQLIMSVGPPEP